MNSLKTYHTISLRIVALSTDVIATSDYTIQRGADSYEDGKANSAANAWAPTRRRDEDGY